jgi:hypothetical protein
MAVRIGLQYDLREGRLCSRDRVCHSYTVRVGNAYQERVRTAHATKQSPGPLGSCEPVPHPEIHGFGCLVRLETLADSVL